MTMDEVNRRGGGSLLQLVAYGAPDNYLLSMGDTSDAQPFNMRDSMASRWFVTREDGAAKNEDMLYSQGTDMTNFEYSTWQSSTILAHVPASMF